MKNRILSFIMMLTCTLVIGQKRYTGKVVDSYNQPIEFANVVVYNKIDSSLLSGVITDENGAFSIDLENEDVYLEISFIGFKTIKITPENRDLGVITLEEDGQLEEVVITARKKIISQKVDRLVFSAENSVASSGGNALDVLKVTPGVNAQNNSLSIIGKQGVRVMINDRIVPLSGEELISYLEAVASDNIKNIEVITTPPSKYDAEGNSGLINIILKKPKENSWSNQIRSSYIQTSYPAVTFGNTFNYNKGKIRILASVDGKKGYKGREVNMNISYPNEPWVGNLKLKNKEDFVSGRFGIDYDISKNSSVGILYSGSFSNKDEESWDTTNIYNANNSIKGSITSNGFNDKKGQNHSVNTHYTQKLDTLGRRLSIDIDFFNYQNPQNRLFSSQRTGNLDHLLKANNISEQDINNFSGKVDIDHPFSWGKLTYGAKISNTSTKNSVNFYDVTSGTPILNVSQSDKFEYNENTQAVYFDIAKTFGSKWQTKLGFRLENTQTEGKSNSYNQTNKKSYLKLFPTFYTTYVKNKNNIFNFNYSRRIKRPGFWSLNPFKWYINSNSYVEGNPFLKPEISDNIEVKHIFKNKLISKAFISFITDGYGQIINVDPSNNQQIYSQSNYYKGLVYGLNETLLYNPTKWWNTINQVSVFTMDMSFSNEIDLGTNIVKGLNFQVYSNHNFFFNTEKTMAFEATFMHSNPQKMLMFELSSSTWLDLGLKMSFLNKNLIATIGVSDVFKTKATDNTTYTNGIKQVYNSYYDSRYLKLGLSYKFGNNKIRVKKRKTSNEGEIKRAKQK